MATTCGNRLDADELVADAERRTGLADWGGDDFRAPFAVLVTACEAESRLSELGRERARQWFALRLEQRLRMVEDRKRRPEIVRQSIDLPIFLMGFPRAGTTYLHTLLSLDPGNVAPAYWQLCLPSPPPNDPAIDHAASIDRIQDLLAYQGWLRPEIARTHFHAADLPEEDFMAFEYSFVSTGFMGFFDVPSYVAEVVAGDFAPAYHWHRRVIEALQVGAEGRRWIFKAPEHTMHVPTLLAEYPDALLVQHHRDPAKVMASVLSVLSLCRSNYCAGDTTIAPDDARAFMHMYAQAVTHASAMRDDPAVDARFVDIAYLDLERAPLDCVRRVYAHSGLELDDAARQRVEAWVNDNRKAKHGKHRYLLSDYGLSEDEVREAFAGYMARFDVQCEGEG